MTNEQPNYETYIQEGFKPVLCKGYHKKYNPTGDYRTAKEPIEKGYQKPEFQGKSLEELDKWLAAGGWVGCVIPPGYMAIDCEDREGLIYSKSVYRSAGIEPAMAITNNGEQHLFKCSGSYPAATAVFTKSGLKVTYRIGGKNYLILPPINGRTWGIWKPISELPELPDALRPYDPRCADDILNCLSWHIGECRRNGSLNGYEDVDCAYMALLISHGLSTDRIHDAFKLAFPADYDRDRTESICVRTRERMAAQDHLIGPGSLIYKAKELELKQLLKFIKEFNKLSGGNGLGQTAGEGDGYEIQGRKYFVDRDGYLCKWKSIRNAWVPIRLANFTATIAEENIEDDGIDVTRRYGVVGQQGNITLPKIEIPSKIFDSLNWTHQWGTRAIIEPGTSVRDCIRHAIQTCSKDTKRVVQYVHTGWREVNGKWLYLSPSGAINGDDVTVKLPRELEKYTLPLIPENEIDAIRASLSFLDIAGPEITYPLLAFTYMAPLTTLLKPMPNFSMYLYGPTGTFKSTISLLQLSHLGTFPGVEGLSNFDDTSNFIEKRAFILKDNLMVLDDFHPSQVRIDAQKKDQVAQRIIRAYGNRTGRGRLNQDTRDKGRYEPRGLLQITGEELVSLQSTLARVLVVELAENDIDIARLAKLQDNAHLLPHAMSSYINWLSGRITQVREEFPAKFKAMRAKASRQGVHKKIPEQAAFLQFAWDTALSWMVEKQAVDSEEAEALSVEGWTIFNDVAHRHSKRIADDDPLKLFEEILQTLIMQERVRLESKVLSSGFVGGSDGELIGYYDNECLYLIPTALWHVITQYCKAEDSRFPASKNSFYKMLRDRKVIEATDDRNVVNVRIRGITTRVLKVVDRRLYEIAVTSATDDEG
jgi:hypothetical protein